MSEQCWVCKQPLGYHEQQIVSPAGVRHNDKDVCIKRLMDRLAAVDKILNADESELVQLMIVNEKHIEEIEQCLTAAESDARRWRYVRDNSTLAGETQEGVYLWEWEALDMNPDSIEADVDASIEAEKGGRDE